LPDPVCRLAIEAAEAYADGVIEEQTAVEAAYAFDRVRRSRFPKQLARDDRAWTAVYCASHRRWETEYGEQQGLVQDRWRVAGVAAMQAAESAEPGETGAQAALLRDVFGNPFRRVTLAPAWLSWRDGTTAKIARALYQDRAFERLPIVADALEDAGCDNPDMLAHCRGEGPHVRGCWVVDLLLGKM
jgi:hypothetical protein